MTPAEPAFWAGWLCRQALPLWSNAGHDEHGFVERLALDGTPQPDVPRRLMVQARQIHAFAIAARRGWYPGAADLALRAGETMVTATGRPTRSQAGRFPAPGAARSPIPVATSTRMRSSFWHWPH